MRVNIVILLVCVAPIFALDFETDVGPCPNPPTVKNFDPVRHAGTWYDIKRYKNTILTGECGHAEYAWHTDAKEYDLTYINSADPNVNITLKPEKLNDGKFRVYREGDKTVLSYWLLDTDYENYDIVWTCVPIVPLLLNTQSLNIFSRQPTLDAAHLAIALNSITARKIDTTRLLDVVQDSATCGRN